MDWTCTYSQVYGSRDHLCWWGPGCYTIQSVQQDQEVEEAEEEEEEEYRPNVAFNQSSSKPDSTFFTGIQNEFQDLLGRDFQIPGLSIDNTASWNQGGGNPNIQGGNFQPGGNYQVQGGGYVQAGGNFQGNGFIQSGANFQIGQNAQGGRNEFALSGGRNQSMMNNPRGGRTSSGSGGRTSVGSGSGRGSGRTSAGSARGRGRRGSA
jgi:hypothetical protein